MLNFQLYQPAKNWLHTWLWGAAIFGVFLLIILPICSNSGVLFRGARGTVWAQEADGAEQENKTCTSCHSEEHEAWQRSIHAAPEGGATCTDCHGEYVRGHPDAGTIPLVVDSSNCINCHATTSEQWQHSLHAGEGVQCISCHRAHDQDLRLTDEKLCSSCHRESLDDSLHSAHWQNEVACTSCHLSDGAKGQSVASSDAMIAVAFAPTHDFVTVSATKCLDCHRDDVKVSAETMPIDGQATTVQQTSGLASKLQSEQKSNHFLTVLSTINLGFGIGIGGILGILFVLVAASVSKRSDRA
jgi:nitrate/TMAO reductase-like tetraheme cytochrome c subunit